jgi:hypothetical protein
MLTPASVGGELELTAPLSPHFRIGAMGFASAMFNIDGYGQTRPLYGGALEIRHVGSGSPHFDLGALAGVMGAHYDDSEHSTAFAAARAGATWESGRYSIETSLALGVATPLFGYTPFDGLYGSAFPIVWASLRIHLPL